MTTQTAEKTRKTSTKATPTKAKGKPRGKPVADARAKAAAEAKAAEAKAQEEQATAPEPEVEATEETAPEGIVMLKASEKAEAIKAKHAESSMSLATALVPGKSHIATLTPDALKELAFISTYESKDSQSTSPTQRGYQREPMESRFPGIGRYYARGDNRNTITPIIASARVYNQEDRNRFNTLFNRGEIGTIHKEFTKSVFSIIDGQHRMNGLHWAWENVKNFNAQVPVIVFYGLRYEEEAQLFDDINTNQRKLPKALIEATKVHMEFGGESHAQKIREIAFALAQDGDSPWNGLVNMTGAHAPDKPVTFEGLRRATATMFPDRINSRLAQRNLNPQLVAKRYWSMVSKACAPAWNNHPREVVNEDGDVEEVLVAYRLKDVAGVAALSRLGESILATSLDKSAKDDSVFWDSMSDLVSQLGAVDWEKRSDNPWQSFGAGFAGARGLAEVLYALVYMDKYPGVSAENENGED